MSYLCQKVYKSHNIFSILSFSDQGVQSPPSCDQKNCNDPHDLEKNQDDLYALLIIPILGFLSGIAAFIVRRFKDRLLFIIIDRIFGCSVSGEGDHSDSVDTDTTTANTTHVKQRLKDHRVSSQSISSIYPASSVSSDRWNERIQTDAKKIFDDMMEERDDVSQLSSSLIELQDKATQVTDTNSTDTEIEMHEISALRSGEELTDSEQIIEEMETSFIETRSGHKYEKIFVVRK